MRIKLSLRDPTVRAVLYQVLVLGGVAAVIWFLVANTTHNLEVRKIATGFGFLGREAGLPIGEHMIDYSPADTYARALFVGILNTLRVAVIGIIFATILGTIIGIARLSRNWLLSKAASIYVEVIRNLPLLLQLIFWWTFFKDSLPGPREPLNPVPGVYISNRGVNFPVPLDDPAHPYILFAFIVGIIASIGFYRWAKRRQDATGQQSPVLLGSAALILGLPFLVFLIGGAPATMDWPVAGRFSLTGGANVTPEFVALLIGLVTYTAAFVAEIVRSGIMAISHGQTEAASALGLRRSLSLRLVLLPQALRVIIPPMTSQYLNLTKNSSLAVAIGYPDIVSIANTTLNQTGQAIEGVAIIMAAYLTVSLSISAFMNWYNKRIALVER
jgi:general L-amino acid transport system permease protein